MKIYVVSHYYDNGESYEDYRDYEDHEYYSTLEKASSAFWSYVTSDYAGRYELARKTLDTQESELLEESAWIECKPYYSDDYFQHVLEDSCYDAECDCSACYENTAMDDCNEAWNTYELEEQRDEINYLYSKNTNYLEWEAVNKEIEERKKQIELESLNEMLEELLTI